MATRNEARAARAKAALRAYADFKGEVFDIDTDMRDLLADLMHLCDRPRCKQEFTHEVRIAQENYNAEKGK